MDHALVCNMETLEEIIAAILRDYAVDGIIKSKGEDWAVINDDELTFRVNYCLTTLKHCVSVDNRKCFNKDSQCPIHFMLDLSNRKNNRLHQALRFLRTEEGEKASATFNWTGWDEFGYHVRDKFYKD